MSVCIEVHLQSARLPDIDWLAASVGSMLPGFAFAEAFDLASETGWCPCLLGPEACGFEWELETGDIDVPVSLATRRFDAVARIGYRSSPQDAICATAVAANIANIAGGVVCTPDGDCIEPDDALTWASDILRDLRKGSRARSPKKREPAQTPHQRVNAWLSALVGAEVDALIRSLPDDPTIAVRYGSALRFRAKRWAIEQDGDSADVWSTECFPRAMTDAQVLRLEEIFQRLVSVLRSGPVVEASYDPATHAIRIAHPGGAFRLAARAGFPLSGEDLLFSDGDLWELEKDKVRIRPDEETGELEVFG